MISPKNPGDFIVITTVERNRAAARWKEMMEKDFDIGYIPGIDQPSPAMRTAAAEEYAAYQLVKSIANSTRSLQHWGQPPEATPSILTWMNADCDRVVGIMSRVFTAQGGASQVANFAFTIIRNTSRCYANGSYGYPA
jgi:hypothetical protein